MDPPVGNNYYQTLGVKRDASLRDIQSAYRRLARKYHPDVTGGDKAAEARFKTINEAHEVLSDSAKRAAYDKWGTRWMHAEQLDAMRGRGGFRGSGPGASGIHFEFPGDGNPFEGPAYEDLGAGNVGGLFDRLFQGAGRPGGVARARGQVLRQPVTVSLAEAYRGSSRTVQVQRPEPCPTCGGSGRVGNVGCHACHGSGRHAGGTRLEVTIPPGVETGTKIRLRGKGGPGTGGGPAGDVVLEVQIAEDSRFERRGAALHTEAPVPLTIAVLGGEVTLPTVTGEIALRVPEGTQNGRVFRLSGRGMPVMNSDKVGDLFAKVRVILPEQLTDIQRALFAQLRDLESGETTAASA